MVGLCFDFFIISIVMDIFIRIIWNVMDIFLYFLGNIMDIII